MPSVLPWILLPLVAMPPVPDTDSPGLGLSSEIAHQGYDQRVCHVSLGWSCRHRGMAPCSLVLSHLCVLLHSVVDQRVLRRVSETLVWSSGAVSCCAAGGWKGFSTMAGQQDCPHCTVVQGTQLDFNIEWVIGVWQVFSLLVEVRCVCVCF